MEDADPKLSTILKLAEALQVSPHDLLPGSRDRARPEDLRNIRDATDASREVFNRLKPTIATLKRLLGCDRSTYAPDLLSGCAQVLDRELTALFRLLADA